MCSVLGNRNGIVAFTSGPKSVTGRSYDLALKITLHAKDPDQDGERLQKTRKLCTIKSRSFTESKLCVWDAG